jgi:uncharacterized protein
MRLSEALARRRTARSLGAVVSAIATLVAALLVPLTFASGSASAGIWVAGVEMHGGVVVSERIVPVKALSSTVRKKIPAPLKGFKQVRLIVVRKDGKEVTYCAALADEPKSQQQGMMGRKDIGGHDAMVFKFAAEQEGGFWMRTVPIGLDIAWFDRNGRFVDGTTMAACGDDPACPIYPAKGAYQYAVENLVGDGRKLGLVAGSRIKLGGACK